MNKFKLTDFLIVVFLISIIASCSNKQSANGIIEIDAFRKYPQLDLDLDEIAEIRYIPLKLGEDTAFINPGYGRYFFATHNRFYLNNGSVDDPKIIVYDYEGNPLYKIGNKGRGPGEFMAPFTYAVDTLRGEVFINSSMQDRIIVYDTNGNFKRSADFSERLRIKSMDLINDNTLLGYNPRVTYVVPTGLSGAGRIRKSGRTISLIDIDSLSLIDFPDLSFKRIYNANQTWGAPKSIVKSGNGIYFFSICSDTTYHISKSLEISPRFVDVSSYPNKEENGIYPVIENDRYVFLYSQPVLQAMIQLEEKQLKLLAYDKIQNKLFDLAKGIMRKNPDGSVSNHFTESLNFAFFFEGTTLNHNYLARSLSYKTLLDNYTNLPDTLKRITDKMTENDNPVLQVVKFK